MAEILIALLLASSPTLRDASEPTPITDGTPTTTDDAVVALVRGGRPFCTATLVEPRVVLTAAHCVADEDFDIEIGPRVDGRGRRITVARVVVHPDFELATLRADIAAVVLEDEVADIEPVPWSDVAMSAADVGTSLRIVGFGFVAPSDRSPSLEREGMTEIVDVDATSFRIGRLPSQTCMGDSGGPALRVMGGVEHVVGITSSGDYECASFGVLTRVDIYSRGFLHDVVDGLDDEDARGCAIDRGRVGIVPWIGIGAMAWWWRRRQRDAGHEGTRGEATARR